MNNVAHFSHNDLDGVGGIHLSRYAFGKKLTSVCPMNNTEVDQKVLDFVTKRWNKDTLLVITDVSVNEEVAQVIQSRHVDGYPVVLLDHHATATYLNKYDWANVVIEENDQKVCATFLYYKYLVENDWITPAQKLTEYVENIRSYDVWDWFHTDNLLAKQLNDYFYMVGLAPFEAWIKEEMENVQESFQLSKEVSTLLQVEENRIQKYIDKKAKQLIIQQKSFLGKLYNVGYVANENYHSELGNTLCQLNPDMDFVVMIDIGQHKVSLRTAKDNVNVSAIAKFYGGGGHPKASGCSITPTSAPSLLQPLLDSILMPVLV